jgi:hypothetical protein
MHFQVLLAVPLMWNYLLLEEVVAQDTSAVAEEVAEVTLPSHLTQ